MLDNKRNKTSKQKTGGRVLPDGTNYARHAQSTYLSRKQTPSSLDGYRLVKKWPKITVYVNDTKKEVVFAIRGTKLTSRNILGDITTNIDIIKGIEKFSPEYRHVKIRFREMVAMFPGYKFVITGHSKGGRLAIDLGYDFPHIVKRVYTFASGSSAVHQARYRLQPKYRQYIKSKVENERVTGDPLSLLVENPINLKKKQGLNPHTIKNFM